MCLPLPEICFPEARSLFREEWDAFRSRIEELLAQQCAIHEALFAQMVREAYVPRSAVPVLRHMAPAVASVSLTPASLADGGKKATRRTRTDKTKRGLQTSMGRAVTGSMNQDAAMESPTSGGTLAKRATSLEDQLAAVLLAVSQVDAKVSAFGGDVAIGTLQWKSPEDPDNGAPSSWPTISEAEYHTGQSAQKMSPPVDSPARAHVASVMELWGGRMNANVWWRQYLTSTATAAVTRWQQLEEPTPQGRLAACVLSRQFEAIVLVVILANASFMWCALDYEASHLGEDDSPAMHVIETFFLAFYIVELALKISVHRQWFFVNKDMWFNWFDMVLLVSSVARMVLLEVVDVGSSANLTFVRTVRVLKLTTLLRGLRIIKQLDELRTMLISLLGSVMSLMWGIILLVLIFYVFGSVFVQGAIIALTDPAASLSDDEREQVSKVFGSVERAMFALYRSCTGGDDWSNIYRPASAIGEPYAALFCFFIAFSQIALLNILTAIFLNKALEVAKPDKDTAGIQQRKLELAAYEEVCALGQELDIRRNGFIRVVDFDRDVRHGNLGARLALLGLNVTDAEYFFHLLTASDKKAGSKPHEVSVDAFIEGCMRMRGAASGIDLCCVEKQTQLILRRLREHKEESSQRLSVLTDAIKVLCQSDERLVSTVRSHQPQSPRHE